MVGKACLPSNAYYPRMPDYTLCSGVYVCWSEHSDSSFIYGFMSLDYGFGTMNATTSVSFLPFSGRWHKMTHDPYTIYQKFKRLYLLNLWMEIVYICLDVRYWSEVLYCTNQTYMSDLEVKVMVKCFWFLQGFIF